MSVRHVSYGNKNRHLRPPGYQQEIEGIRVIHAVVQLWWGPRIHFAYAQLIPTSLAASLPALFFPIYLTNSFDFCSILRRRGALFRAFVFALRDLKC